MAEGCRMQGAYMLHEGCGALPHSANRLCRVITVEEAPIDSA
jgi:hypothetical protein